MGATHGQYHLVTIVFQLASFGQLALLSVRPLLGLANLLVLDKVCAKCVTFGHFSLGTTNVPIRYSSPVTIVYQVATFGN